MRGLSRLSLGVLAPIVTGFTPCISSKVFVDSVCFASASRPYQDEREVERPGAPLREYVQHFQSNQRYRDESLKHYISSELFLKSSTEYFDKFDDGNLRHSINGTQQDATNGDSVFHSYLDFARLNYAFDILRYQSIVNARDLSKPHTWFPIARAIKRKIIYHAGPTNSGKTYNALLAMKNARSGVYCGPLRLLAMEVYESCNVEGTFCSLITGQEQQEVPGARHTACTVEMINLEKRVDVAVIDEIQLIGDDSRGWAWTRALLGVPATEIHVCGDGSAIGLVKCLAEHVGEEFEIKTYERFTPLEVEDIGMVDGYSGVSPGDCIVAFSRHDIFTIKALIEQKTPYKTCVVYGALPPETRRQQAKLFNDPESGYDIMVASDAVGMGLNLNIRRVIFHKMDKREGHLKPSRPVSVSMIKQIAGRAGRRSSQYSHGKATCLEKDDIGRLKDGLSVPQEHLATLKAGIYPEFEHFEAFATGKEFNSFTRLLDEFSKQAILSGKYFFCKHDSTLALAKLLEKVDGMSLKDLYSWCMAPASTTDLRISAAMLHFAKKYASGQSCEFEIDPGEVAPTTPDAMRDFEAAHQVAMLWLWLSNRFDPIYFPNKEKASKIASKICHLLSQGLAIISKDDKQRGIVERKMKVQSVQNMSGTQTTVKNTRVCKTGKQLFTPYRQEFFLLLNELRASEDKETHGNALGQTNP